ncbi:elongin-A-like [Dama dama]|uniref:elongin-A-like n=1 Tax=Dama dama TaxID=30532 RepID=UPI002A359FEE|nr:elongin-A-like [Dama dama]
MEGDGRAHLADRSGRSHGREDRRQRHRLPSEHARPHRGSRDRERDEDRRQCRRGSPAYSSERGYCGYSRSPPPATRPLLMSGDRHRRPSEAYIVQWGPGEGPYDAPRAILGFSQEHRLSAPHGREAGSLSWGHQPPHKDKRPLGAKEYEKSSTLTSQKAVLASSTEKSPRSVPRDKAKENPPSTGIKEKERRRCGIQFSPSVGHPSVLNFKKQKQEDSEKTKADKNKQILNHLDIAEGTRGLLPKVKEKATNNQKIQEGKVRPPHLDGKPDGSLPEVEETDMDNEFKPPTMSFHSFLNQDQPKEKKKMIMKTSATALEEKEPKKNDSSQNLDLVQELPEVNENRSEKLQPSGNVWAKLEKVPTDAPVWPDLPLPRISAKYHPLPASRLIRPKQKALSSPQEEEKVGFTGCRMNSKMQVFSGSKCAYLAKMMTLRQQCIWVLKNNINSIFKVGGVPYSVLEPILKSCAPDQLYRIEKYNHALVQETDQLWKIHCHQNFRKERPQEHESWREMYMRLQDAQEQRLRALTVNIQSAHANKPKGRQAKMILLNSLARPPSDVQRRQQFETGEAAVPEKVKIKPAPSPTETSHTPSSINSLNLIHEKPAHTCSSATSTHLPQVGSGRKRVKKIAPMMAKTIKDFKNRFSRR